MTHTITTLTGIELDLAAPDKSMIVLEDISSGLAKCCRWAGQIRQFYSVAQHSCILFKMVPDHLKALALFHDAPEAYFGDHTKPYKLLLGPIADEIEGRFRDVIWGMYGCDASLYPELKEYEKRLEGLERQFLKHGDDREWIPLMESLGLHPGAWLPSAAELNFMYCYKILNHIRG